MGWPRWAQTPTWWTPKSIVLEALTLQMKTTLSETQDLDYTTAITKMNRDQLALEAAQSSFAKISKLSLFNYLG